MFSQVDPLFICLKVEKILLRFELEKWFDVNLDHPTCGSVARKSRGESRKGASRTIHVRQNTAMKSFRGISVGLRDFFGF